MLALLARFLGVRVRISSSRVEEVGANDGVKVWLGARIVQVFAEMKDEAVGKLILNCFLRTGRAIRLAREL